VTRLDPVRASRLLRAKEGELEARVLGLGELIDRAALSSADAYLTGQLQSIAGDLALLAGLLADALDREVAR
jgi:hypothetical protein